MSFRQGARQFFERRGAPTPPMPYDARVLYVETDGAGSYFNTGVTPTYKTVVHVTCQCISVPRDNSTNLVSNPLFGAASGTGIATGNLQLVAQTGNSVFKTYMPAITGSFPPYDSDEHDVVLGSGRFEFDGVPFSAGTVSAGRAFGQFCLGSRGTYCMTGSTAGTGFTDSRFYSCRIYTDGVLVFDGIPVRKDGAGYIYDRVSGRLCGNAGEAGTSVTFGPDLIYDERVSYVETDGVGSYIDTGIIPNLYGDSQSRVSVTFAVQTLANSLSPFGARYNTGGAVAFCGTIAITSSADRIQFLRPTVATTSPLSPADTAIHEVTMYNGGAVVDGNPVSASTVSSGTPTTNFMLGCSGDPSLHPLDSSSYKPCRTRFYACKIETGGVIVFDGIPVRKNGQGYIYDRISGRMYGNANTSGSVTYGPDKSVEVS